MPSFMADPARQHGNLYSSASAICAMERQCRICWGDEDCASGGRLVSPCACAGTLEHIHIRCLQDWQQVLRTQGQFKKARSCEVCKQPYRALNHADSGSDGGRGWLRALLSRVNQQLLDVTRSQSWTVLIYRCWKLYIFGSSLVGATRTGLAGLRAGFGMGKTLVEEQASILLRMLAAMGDLFGTPCAELIWCQAVACLAFALLTEMVYTTVLGLALGTVVGFFRGYVNALHATVAVAGHGVARSLMATRGLAKIVRGAWRLPWQSLRAVALLASRALPTRLL